MCLINNITIGRFHYIIVVFIYIIHVRQVTCESRITPSGIKLCERICLKTAGCLYYIFLTNNLACDATGTTGKDTNSFAITKETSKPDAECESGSQIFITRQGQHKCEIKRDVHGKNVLKNNYIKERIIFLAHRTPTQEVVIYHPANKSFETVNLVIEDIYHGVADLSSSEILLYNSAKQLKIFKLHERRSEDIETGIKIVDMAKGDMCVYLLTGSDIHPKLKVVKKNIINHEITTWWRVKALPLGLADCTKIEYDEHNSVLYLLNHFTGKVHRLDVLSGKLTILANGLWAQNFALDGRNELLYYSFYSSVKYLNLTDKSCKKMHKLEFNILSIGFCEGSLFVSSRDADGLIYECGKTCTPLEFFNFKSKILIA